MDELEFYNGIWTGQQIDDAIGRTGFAKLLQSTDNLNSVIDNGFYYWTNGIPTNAPDATFGYAYMIVIRRSDTYVTQVCYRGGNQIVIRQIVNSVPTSWEWANGIPMTAASENDAVEYETAERFNGKVVYCKTISVGSMATGNNLAAIFASGLTSRPTIVRHSVFGQINSTNWCNMPFDNGTQAIKVNPLVYSGNSGTTWSCRIYINTNAALTNVVATLWYTKD